MSGHELNVEQKKKRAGHGTLGSPARTVDLADAIPHAPALSSFPGLSFATLSQAPIQTRRQTLATKAWARFAAKDGRAYIDKGLEKT
ncbi:hypothetical protein MTO96_002333 [Rhipicephalus appendiculatus]